MTGTGRVGGESTAGDASAALPARYPGSRLGRPYEGPGSVAGIGRRLLALVIDWAAALLIARLVLGGHMDALRGRGSLVPLLVLGLMNWLLIGTAGATIGQRLLGMRVETVTGAAPGPGRALVRAVLLCLALPPLTLLVEPDQRGLHDRAAGTLLVRR